MKSYGKILSVFLSLILLFSGCGKYNTNLRGKIKSYVDNNANHDIVLELSLFTDFEWDKVVIYKYPTTSDEIYQMVGIEYEPSDLSSGWFFVLDDQIVYEETFETNFESLPLFFVYPYKDINAKEKCNVLDKKNSILICEVLESDNQIGYSLYPQNT